MFWAPTVYIRIKEYRIFVLSVLGPVSAVDGVPNNYILTTLTDYR